MKNKILITGMHRSGTSYLGKLLNLCLNNSSLLFEPSNKDYGDHRVDEWYLSVNRNIKLLNDILTLKLSYKKYFLTESDSLTKFLGRSIFGSKGYRSYLNCKINNFINNNNKIIIKDPFLLSSIDYFLRNDVKTIAIVRHPAAIYKSINNKKWNIDISKFKGRKIFETTIKEEYYANQNEINKLHIQVALLWNMLYSNLFNSKNNKNLKIITHEDLCMNPISIIREIENFLNFKSSDKGIDFVKNSTTSTLINSSENEVHNYYRDSKKLAFSWIKSANQNEYAKMQSIIGNNINKYYEKWLIK